MRKIFSKSLLTVLLIISAWFISCGLFFNNPVLVEKSDFLMGSVVNIKIYAESRQKGEKIINDALAEAKRIENIMEPLKGKGEMVRINTRIYNTPQPINSETKEILSKIQYYYSISGGAFDPTIGPVKWLWDFDNEGQIPPKECIAMKLKSVGLSKVHIKGDSLIFSDPGTKIDTGGAAQGFAADKMTAILKKEGALSGIVNVSGDIYIFGKKLKRRFWGLKSASDGEDWVIGVRHPRLNKTIVLPPISLPSVATSGDYERYFMKDGIRYHHILDPSTGYPSRGCISVTVWTKTALDSDILSTTLFVMGAEKGIDLAEKLPDVEALIFYEKNGEVKAVMTSGLKNRITL